MFSVSIQQSADSYRAAKAFGRKLTHADLAHFDRTMRPFGRGGSGRLDINARPSFTENEVTYASLLVDIEGSGLRPLSEEEQAFAEVALRYAYVRQISK